MTEKVVPNNGELSEPNEEIVAELRKRLGLESSEPKFFDSPWFHGDFGHSFDLRSLMTVLIVIVVGIFGIFYVKKKRKARVGKE